MVLRCCGFTKYTVTLQAQSWSLAALMLFQSSKIGIKRGWGWCRRMLRVLASGRADHSGCCTRTVGLALISILLSYTHTSLLISKLIFKSKLCCLWYCLLFVWYPLLIGLIRVIVILVFCSQYHSIGIAVPQLGATTCHPSYIRPGCIQHHQHCWNVLLRRIQMCSCSIL